MYGLTNQAKLSLFAVIVLLAGVPSAPYAGIFVFTKKTNTNSKLQYQWMRTDGAPPTISGEWRAGSGVNRSCEKGKGWLPNGTYSVRSHQHHLNGLIKGRVWQLSDKYCPGPRKIKRTELFIHTEETEDNGQTCTSAPDDKYCWEGSNDYKSQGCVKVSHRDIASVDTLYHNRNTRLGHARTLLVR